jgi:hypothetical protein
MIGEGAGELGPGRRVDRRGKVDAGHLGAERGMQRSDP